MVNTPGCEPGIREFNSHHSPQNNETSPKILPKEAKIKKGDFLNEIHGRRQTQVCEDAS